MNEKILILRMSSFGDIIQCLSVITPILEKFPNAEIDWVVRDDLSELPHLDSRINRVWTVPRRSGVSGLLALAWELRHENYTKVYDAHSNIRSRIICAILRTSSSLYSSRFTFQANQTRGVIGKLEFSILENLSALRIPSIIRRSKERMKRLLLFSFNINFFPRPYRGMKSYLKPLKKWGVSQLGEHFLAPNFSHELKTKFESAGFSAQIERSIIIVPSAAWEMKRWPISHWKELIKKSSYNFVILGGPSDNFCEDLYQVAPERVVNLAGKLSILESCYAIWLAPLTISADTGLIHVADIFGKNGILLVGPTAFGFTTSEKIQILEVDLNCRPCSKDGSGRCKREKYQQCMTDISVQMVLQAIETKR